MRKKVFIILFMPLALMASFYAGASGKTNFYISKDKRAALKKEEVLLAKDKYITVGTKGSEFKTLKGGIEAADSRRKIIYIMDNVLTECSIRITKDIEIRGFGRDKTTLQASASLNTSKDRVFMIEKNAKVVMSGFAIRYGRVTKVPRCGAGIYNKGNLTITDCWIHDNLCTYGVGINNEGTLEMKNSIISANSGLKRPAIDQRNGVDCGGSGCGMKVEKKGVARLSGCLIMNNMSVANGGGIHISCEGKAVLTNCTIINNKAELEGGGISVRGDLEITHCTITKNSASKGNGIFAMGKVFMSGNIVAGNYKSDLAIGSGFGVYGKGTLEKNEFNLIEYSSIKAFLSADPKLLPLADNGGPTMTCALKSDSPAINAIPQDKSLVKNDQRGFSRASGPSDLGAYEYTN